MLMRLSPELRHQIFCSGLKMQDLLALELCSSSLRRELQQPGAASPWRIVWSDDIFHGKPSDYAFGTVPQDFDFRDRCKLMMYLRQVERQIRGNTISMKVCDPINDVQPPLSASKYIALSFWRAVVRIRGAIRALVLSLTFQRDRNHVV